MRNRSQSVHDQLRARAHGAHPASARHAAVGGPPLAALTAGLQLPTIGDDVPRCYSPAKRRCVSGIIAQFLLDAGVIARASFPTAVLSVDHVCDTVLDQWLHDQIGPLQCLSLYVEMKASHWRNAPDDEQREQCPYDASEAAEIQGLHVWWSASDVRRWVIGPALDDLERQLPGLGKAVWSVMDGQARRCYPLFTPVVALEQASYLYWLGGEDETEALELLREEGGSDEDVAAIVTLQDFKEAFPAWTLLSTPDGNHADADVALLRQAEVRLGDPQQRRIAALALALAGVDIDRDYAVRTEYDNIGYGAVLCWMEDDLTVRVSEAMAENAYASDYCDLIGETVIPIDEPLAMQDWMRHSVPHLEAIRLIDQLLWELAA